MVRIRLYRAKRVCIQLVVKIQQRLATGPDLRVDHIGFIEDLDLSHPDVERVRSQNLPADQVSCLRVRDLEFSRRQHGHVRQAGDAGDKLAPQLVEEVAEQPRNIRYDRVLIDWLIRLRRIANHAEQFLPSRYNGVASGMGGPTGMAGLTSG